MDQVLERAAALDVHKAQLTACVRFPGTDGRPREEVREFKTTVRELLGLRDWLAGLGVRQVAMEATGVYWRPVWAVLEDEFELLLVNPHHIKAIPGRKTDTKDCEWIADLLQHGLVRGSFVPPTDIQDL